MRKVAGKESRVIYSDEGKSPELGRIKPPVPGEAARPKRGFPDFGSCYIPLVVSLVLDANKSSRSDLASAARRPVFGARQGFFWPLY